MKKLLVVVLLALMAATCEENDLQCIDESKIDPDMMCITLYDPVCGCDGKTYGNECEASKAGVLHWTDGECE